MRLAVRPLQESLELLALSDAYEVAGNQLFRMAVILEQDRARCTRWTEAQNRA
jgi:hypothetical protein